MNGKKKALILSVAILSVLIISAVILPNLLPGSRNVQPTVDSLIRPETWAATDGLGRTLPVKGEVRKKNDRKFVGLFYWTWHTSFAKNNEPLNATRILAEHPEILHDYNSPLWQSENSGRPYFWDEPLYGYYRDTDEYVLRKHAELIADAGVDVIFFDCTNLSETWDESCEKLFEIFEKAKDDGVNVPKVAYMLPFNDGQDAATSLKHLYGDIYSKGRYSDLWFMWDGKPLIMAHPSALDETDAAQKEILDFFTFRENDPGYFSSDRKYAQKLWGWCSDWPQARYGTSAIGRTEQICVSVAQNAADGELVAMNADGNVQGRSFSKDGYSYSYKTGGKEITVDKDTPDSLLYGLNFQQQWDYAIAKDPNFIFVTGWNEWIAGRFDEWQGTVNAFPDEFSPEFSRDIEPSAGALGDNYYYQLAANIRRFKGVSSTTVVEDGKKTYYHYTNGVPVRDSDGWIGTHYSSDTVRNDIVSAQVSDDGETIYMTIRTKDDVSAPGKAWMRVFIDTDTQNASPNWEGFEYVVNRDGAGENVVTVERSTGGWAFEKTGEAKYLVSGSEMKLEIPAAALGLTGRVRFNFKISDNMQADGDILDFYKNGDVAPGGRFTFVYD